MPRRRTSLQGSALLGLVVLQALVAPPCFVGVSGRILTESPPTGGICATSVVVLGYKCQEFQVTTEDGYILSLQRIPECRYGPASVPLQGKKPPVIVQHGLLVDGMSWFLNQADQDLPLILAEQGFDVWITNARGTVFSRKHVKLDPKSEEFWNWSWDEMVAYDLPAIFDFVNKQTQQKIHYVGHSMGTLIMLASLSEGKLQGKVRSAALLSPVAFLNHMTTTLGVLACKSFLGEAVAMMGLAKFNPTGKEFSEFLHKLCVDSGMDCYDMITSFTGKNCCLNSSTVEKALKYEPQATATQNMVHLVQTVKSGRISKYDYGNAISNLQHYGTATPPDYNLANIPRDLPLFFSYGGKDSLADPDDVQELLDLIKDHDVDKLHVEFVKDYAHADFMMGTNAKDVVYNKVVSFFKSH